MGFEIIKLDDPGVNPAPAVVAKQRLWLTADDKLVLDGDLDARFLFCSPGDEIPRADALRYGLLDSSDLDAEEFMEEPKPEEPAEEKAAEPEPEPPAEKEQAAEPQEEPEPEPEAEEKPKAKKQKKQKG